MATPTPVTINASFSPLLAAERVTFRITHPIMHASGPSVVLPGDQLQVDVPANGIWSLPVYGTNDPDWNPSNWTYQVTIEGANLYKQYSVSVPYNAGSMDFSDLLPVVASPGNLYAGYNHTHDVSASVDPRILLDPRRVVVPGELVLARQEVGGKYQLATGNLYLTYFQAAVTETILTLQTSIQHVSDVATGTTNSWIGVMDWDPVTNILTPNTVSVDDPSRWAAKATYNTQVFGVDQFGSANLGDPGFQKVAGEYYAVFHQWVGSGNGPKLPACIVNEDDSMLDPRQNAYMPLLAPPSSALQAGWVAPSPAMIQALMKR